MTQRKDRYRRIIASIALLVTLACGCGGRAAVDSSGKLVSEEGRIALTRITGQTGANIESDVYTANVDGTGEVRLTDAPGLDGMSAWSPDGRRIAFVSDRDGSWEIYVMAADGTGQRRLTNTPVDEGAPAWSPDGKKIAYLVDPFGDPTISGRKTARLAPPRRGSLGHMDLYAADRIDLTVRDVRALARAALSVVQPEQSAPERLLAAIRGLARATEALAAYLQSSGTPPDETRRLALEAAREASALLEEHEDLSRNLGTNALVDQIHSSTVDLMGGTGMDRAAALRALEEATGRASW
jgi:WD40-like Beta Propeller Repeat